MFKTQLLKTPYKLVPGQTLLVKHLKFAHQAMFERLATSQKHCLTGKNKRNSLQNS